MITQNSERRLRAFGSLRSWGSGWVMALSFLLILPCFWLPRIQAGDLSSHIYNSWLTQLIESGRVEGMVLAPQKTNVLFDLALSRLYAAFGAEAAQRIAVSASVLLFSWGAFAFLSTVARRRVWHMLPCLAMFAYGWVFHMGFFNFYVSMGLCLWALAAAWKCKRQGLAIAAPILLLASTAHALPVAWAASLLAYLWIARHIGPRYRPAMTAVCLAVMVLTHVVLRSNFAVRWSPLQISVSTGADQMRVFGSKYSWILIGMLLCWGLLFLDLLHQRGVRRIALGIPFQLCVLSGASVVALPAAIFIPGYESALAYIPERMSLGVGICVCALVGVARPKRWEGIGIGVLAAAFFSFLYVDERELNRFEDQMQSVVASLPRGERLVSGIADGASRVNMLAHTIDRVCIGHCFSYANYEPSTAQFRVRAVRPNPYVAHRYADSFAMQTGTYVIRESDPPLSQIVMSADGSPQVVALRVGNPCRITKLNLFPDWIAGKRATAALASLSRPGSL